MKTAELTTYPARDAVPFPDGGRRALIYVVYDRRGDVEDYILYALEQLRRHCDTIIAVVNGKLTPDGRQRLEKVSDEVLQRENRGFDIAGYKHGLDHLGDRVAEYDEIILANDTWYGPVRSFAPVFERMDRQELHFWGMTDHPRVEPNPFTGTGYLAYHLQSYWLVVRRDMFLSREWTDYWRALPELNTYEDAVVKHEAVFTEIFISHGFVGEVAFPTITDKIENHAVLYPEQLLDAGCPTLKRRPFFQWPPYMDRLATIGRWTLDAAVRYGYPRSLLMQDLARNVAPRTLNADAAMLEVLPGGAGAYAEEQPLRVVVVAHIYYPEMTTEIIDRVDLLPCGYDLIVTTADEERAASIRGLLAARGELRGRVEVRVATTNEGRDQSAFLIDTRDVILSDEYDLILKVHSKRTPQDGFNAGRGFVAQQFDNLLADAEYASNVLALFQQDPTLGIAYPPMVHIGYGTMGHAWWSNRERFIEVAANLDVRVPVDEVSPLAPFGSMYFARPQALRILALAQWTAEDFDGEAYSDGGLAHVLERLPSYVAGEAGYTTRTIACTEYFASSYTALEYNLDQMSSRMLDSTMQQIQLLRQAGDFGRGTLEDFAYMYARLNRPQWEPRLRSFFDRSTRWRAAFWKLRHPKSWLRHG
ncbi:rhamnan synthesis F family protein [Microbacterium sp.]|uniref:rhamnan synthesis F family protein n=1 Tax=Microbacterium sp. TaxID=51671 RepID=UPI0039E45EB7